DGMVARLTPGDYSRKQVLETIRELTTEGYIQLGAFPGGGQSWEPWEISVDEGLHRISHGYNGQAGYLDIPDSDIGSNEVFRADFTELGEHRLSELGNPYKKYAIRAASSSFLADIASSSSKNNFNW
ncbi:MAG: hypothetical protein J2P18_16760, partial [Nocardia sp.]|nr:hypothetical protein [Nocardia sp.]